MRDEGWGKEADPWELSSVSDSSRGFSLIPHPSSRFPHPPSLFPLVTQVELDEWH